MFKTPVLLVMFNRPDYTAKVFEAIRKQSPGRLYIAADGPRPGNHNDVILGNQCKQIVANVDWACEVKTLYAEQNAGSGRAVSAAVTWLFEHEEEGIILEDDCLPNDGFFFFCETLLAQYRSDQRVMHITGTNLNDTVKFGDGSYYYSRYPNIWGWATWKRAWKSFDYELNDTELYMQLIRRTFSHLSERLFWQSRLDLVKAKLVDSWDYQWMFSIWRKNGICLNTNTNLVINIGFGPHATHTFGKSLYINPVTTEITAIRQPSKFEINKKAEAAFLADLHGVKRRRYLNYYSHTYFFQRCLNLLHKIKMHFKGIKN